MTGQPEPPDPDGPPRLLRPDRRYTYAVELDRVTDDWCPTCALPSAWRIRYSVVNWVTLVVERRAICWGCETQGGVSFRVDVPLDGSRDGEFWRPDVHRPHSPAR